MILHFSHIRLIKCILGIVRTCFLLFVMMSVSIGFFSEYLVYWDGDAVELTESLEGEAEQEKEETNKETKTDDYIRRLFDYRFVCYQASLAVGEAFNHWYSLHRKVFTPPPEQI